jgi:SAM-dependent methyltransferase
MEPSQRKQYTEANRAAWNEVMPKHQKAAREKWDHAFLQPGYSCIDDIELKQLKMVGIRGKDIAHLCCNNGIELLSLKNLGAGNCIGFDISDEAILEATQRAELCSIPCQFIRTDVYDISHKFDEKFDMIYISIGCFGWLPDLQRFFEIAARLLRDNGIVFIHEEHPFAELLPNDDTEQADVLHISDSYFKTEPYVDYGDLDYVGNSHYESQKPQYWFVHKLSDILMALIDHHLAIQHFSEYEVDISASKKRIEDANAGIPLSYILYGRKQIVP